MAIYASFVVLSALLLWAVIYARGPWGVKLALICTVPAFGAVVWHTLDGYRGWPAAQTPPSDAELVAQLVDEPTAIYVWLVAPGSSVPRAYRIAYTRQAHEQVFAALRLQDDGGRVGLRRNRGVYEAYALPPALRSKEAP